MSTATGSERMTLGRHIIDASQDDLPDRRSVLQRQPRECQ
jgi:hypothetical protein